MRVRPVETLTFACLAGIVASCVKSDPQLAVVAAPIVDLRAQPGPPAQSLAHDANQETQALYGERVLIQRIEDDWALIEASEQPEYTHHQKWEGYPGWVHTSDLVLVRGLPPPSAVVVAKWATIWRDPRSEQPIMSLPMGTRLAAERSQTGLLKVQMVDGTVGWISRGDVEWLDELAKHTPELRRRAVVRAADELIGDPYFWGGRSPRADSSEQVTGADCSGVVSLAYRAAGIVIPRDAHEQFMRARAVDQLQTADLVFLSEAGNPSKIVHVMLYAGDGWLIEGPGTGLSVRRISVKDRLGRTDAELHSGQTVKEQTIFLGSLL